MFLIAWINQAWTGGGQMVVSGIDRNIRGSKFILIYWTEI